MSVPKQILALSYIGYRTGHHMLRQGYKDVSRLFGAHVIDGIEKFAGNYSADGVVSITADEREKIPSFEKCINCGLCDAVCSNIENIRKMTGSGPSMIASSHSRAHPWYKHAKKFVGEWQNCGDCLKCLEVCPTQVPLKDIVAFMQRVIKSQDEGKIVE